MKHEFCTILCNQTKYYYFPFLEKRLICCLYYCLLCRRRNKHFDVLFWRIRLVLFPSKDGKDVTYEGRNGRKGVNFPPEWASFVFVFNMIKVPFPFCTSTWRVNNYVSRQRKGINTRKESTFIISYKNIALYCTTIIAYFRNLINYRCLKTCFLLKTTIFELCYS